MVDPCRCELTLIVKAIVAQAPALHDLPAERELGRGSLADRLPLLKDLFIREAAGLTGEVPKLLRGEAL
jgi:hypothetical protein